jgi:hypothetical protein
VGRPVHQVRAALLMIRAYRTKCTVLALFMVAAAVMLALDTVSTWTGHQSLGYGAANILADGFLGSFMHSMLINLMDRRAVQRRKVDLEDHQ